MSTRHRVKHRRPNIACRTTTIGGARGQSGHLARRLATAAAGAWAAAAARRLWLLGARPRGNLRLAATGKPVARLRSGGAGRLIAARRLRPRRRRGGGDGGACARRAIAPWRRAFRAAHPLQAVVGEEAVHLPILLLQAAILALQTLDLRVTLAQIRLLRTEKALELVEPRRRARRRARRQLAVRWRARLLGSGLLRSGQRLEQW